MMRYCMIGNSAAAVGCIEGIRQTDPAGEIILFSAEPEFTYSRPLISYLLEGKTDEERMRYRPADFYEKNQVEARLGVQVTAIDRANHTLTDDKGNTTTYDKLLIATGSVPFVPPMQGLELVADPCHFQSLADARKLEGLLAGEKKRVLIIGAGLIGLKCAEGIFDRAASVTVVDLAPRILPSILDEEGSALVQKHLAARGLRFYLGDSVASFEANTAHLKNSGVAVEFDLLVLAVGVRANVSLAADAGLELARGIVTDPTCATTDKDIFAAGDCAVSHDLVTDTDRVLALLPNAYAGGQVAGINMAGGSASLDDAMAMNAMGLFGLHMMTAGSYDGQEIIYRMEGNYKKLVVRDNRLVGFILVGDVARTGIYTALIRNKTPLDTIDFDAICKAPQLMAFSRAARATMLSRKA